MRNGYIADVAKIVPFDDQEIEDQQYDSLPLLTYFSV